MKFEDYEDKFKGSWVKVSDVELSIPSSIYSYAEADVHIPYGAFIMDMEEYTKYVQDKAIKTFADAFVLSHMSLTTCRKIFPEIYKDGERCGMTQILKRYSGSEIMSRLEEYEKKQAEIEKAKSRLEAGGYSVEEAIEVLQALADWLYLSSMNGGTKIQREAIETAIKALEEEARR
jgi:hypothetical protein